MTQPHLLEQAKQGDPQAIAALMNKSLQPKGMTAYVDRQGDHLEVVLKSDRIPNRQALTAFVEQGIHNLGIELLQSVTVSGQQIGSSASAWSETLYLNPLIPGFEPEASSLTETDASFGSDSFGSDNFGSDNFGSDNFGSDNFGSNSDPEATAAFNSSEPADLAQLQDLLSDQSAQSSTDPQRQELENRLESLWTEQSDDQHQDFLSELMAEAPQDATHQFEAFLAEQPDDRFQSQEQEGLWNAPAAQEADDLLADLNLEDSRQALTHQLQETPYPWQQADQEPDQKSEPDSEDEPDEILFNFMEDRAQPPADLGFDENGETIDEPDEILPDFFETSPETSPEASLESASDNTSDVDLLDLLAAEEEQDQDLLLELSDDQPADWNSEGSGQMAEFSLNSSPDAMDELSLAVEAEPVSSQIDFSAGEFEAATDAESPSWEHPPIEFLQAELEPLSLEMPTEQFDSSADFTIEPSLDAPDRPADFPPDFLQESPADQSHDLSVEPQTNPFIEQMEEQDRERSRQPDDKPSEELNQFDQSEWLLEDTDPDTEPQGLSQSQYGESQYGEPQYGEPQYNESPSLENQYLEDSDPLSDQALINFFEEDTDPTHTGSQFSPESEFSTGSEFSGDAEQFSDYRVRPDNPDAPVYPADSSELGLDELPYSYGDLSDPQDDQEEYLDLSLEPDRPESSDDYPDTLIPNPQYPTTAIPDPAYAEGRTVDPEIPDYQEPSPEDLERQVAEIYPEGDRYVVNNTSSEVVDVPSDSRSSPWLFPLILLGISGWIVGLISFAFLWSRLSSPPPETASTSPELVASPNAAPTACPPTTQAVGNVPIALSELQFQPNASNPQQINLTGCVTNRTPQPIDIVSIGYRSGAARNLTVGGLSFSNGVIQPGQTVPFASKFTLPSDTTDVAINTVYWQPAGQTTSKEANTSIDLSR